MCGVCRYSFCTFEPSALAVSGGRAGGIEQHRLLLSGDESSKPLINKSSQRLRWVPHSPVSQAISFIWIRCVNQPPVPNIASFRPIFSVRKLSRANCEVQIANWMKRCQGLVCQVPWMQ